MHRGLWSFNNTSTALAPTGTAKMAALLLQEFEGSEMSKVPKAIQNRLEKLLLDQQYEVDSLKAQHEQFRVDSGKLWLGLKLASSAKVLALFTVHSFSMEQACSKVCSKWLKVYGTLLVVYQ